MTAAARIVAGDATREEAAAVLAAVQLVLESEQASTPQLPWAYRSAWRREAITEGINRIDVS